VWSWVKLKSNVCRYHDLEVSAFVAVFLKQGVHRRCDGAGHDVIDRYFNLFGQTLEQPQVDGPCLADIKVARKSVFSLGDVVIIC